MNKFKSWLLKPVFDTDYQNAAVLSAVVGVLVGVVSLYYYLGGFDSRRKKKR